jgi:hypothetical protein
VPIAAFIDQRANPDAPVMRPIARTTNNPEALAEFHALCRDGRLYDVERWIQADRPLQASQGTAVR